MIGNGANARCIKNGFLIGFHLGRMADKQKFLVIYTKTKVLMLRKFFYINSKLKLHTNKFIYRNLDTHNEAVRYY